MVLAQNRLAYVRWLSVVGNISLAREIHQAHLFPLLILETLTTYYREAYFQGKNDVALGGGAILAEFRLLGHHVDRFFSSMLVFGGITFFAVVSLGWVSSGITEILSLSLISLCACDCALHYFYRVQMFAATNRWSILSFKCLLSGLVFAYVGTFVGSLARDIYLLHRVPYAAGAVPLSFGALGYLLGIFLSLFVCAHSKFQASVQDAIADVDGFALGVFSVMGMELATKAHVFAGIEQNGPQLLSVLASSALTTVCGGAVRTILMFAPPVNTAWIRNRTVLYYWLLGPCSGLLAYETYIFLCGITLKAVNVLYGIGHGDMQQYWSNDLVYFERHLDGGMFVFLYFLYGFGSAVIWLYIRESYKAGQPA